MLPDKAGLELIITDAKVPISVPARARAILDETNAKRGFADGFGRVRGSYSAWSDVQAKGTTETLHQWYARLCSLHSWGLLLRIDVPLYVGDEDVIRSYHELDQHGSSKALVNCHIARCYVAHKIAGSDSDWEED